MLVLDEAWQILQTPFLNPGSSLGHNERVRDQQLSSSSIIWATTASRAASSRCTTVTTGSCFFIAGDRVGDHTPQIP